MAENVCANTHSREQGLHHHSDTAANKTGNQFRSENHNNKCVPADTEGSLNSSRQYLQWNVLKQDRRAIRADSGGWAVVHRLMASEARASTNRDGDKAINGTGQACRPRKNHRVRDQYGNVFSFITAIELEPNQGNCHCLLSLKLTNRISINHRFNCWEKGSDISCYTIKEQGAIRVRADAINQSTITCPQSGWDHITSHTNRIEY